jgi:hypothetical protein
MKQINTPYQLNEPISLIVSNRLAELALFYGGRDLCISMFRSSRRKYLKPIDRHLINLMETYGDSVVIDTYNLIWGQKDLAV